MTNKATTWILLANCLCCCQEGMGQEQSAEKWTPELGVELTSELQLSTLSGETGGGLFAGDGSTNYVNLLRLNAALPIVSPHSERPRATGLSFEIASLSTCMTAAGSIGSEFQTFSNLDAGNIPFALSVCDFALNIGDLHSLFLGIRNMNEDYFTSPATSFFTNSSCGIYPTISANYPIANYPMASVGVHYRYKTTPTPAGQTVGIQVSLYNGTGYNRFTGRENVFRLCPKDDGIFALAEVSYTHGGSSYFLGNALSCREGASATPWFYTEQRIIPRLTLLTGCSHAFCAEAECKDFIGLGALYEMGHCQLGAFADYAHFRERDEFATELTCNVPILQHLDLQPTVHLITYDGRFQCAATLRLALSI